MTSPSCFFDRASNISQPIAIVIKRAEYSSSFFPSFPAAHAIIVSCASKKYSNTSPKSLRVDFTVSVNDCRARSDSKKSSHFLEKRPKYAFTWNALQAGLNTSSSSSLHSQSGCFHPLKGNAIVQNRSDTVSSDFDALLGQIDTSFLGLRRKISNMTFPQLRS